MAINWDVLPHAPIIHQERSAGDCERVTVRAEGIAALPVALNVTGPAEGSS